MTNEVKKQPIPTKEECLAFYKELAKLADVRFVPYYNMAIEALNQEPCDDAISREDVIKAVDRHTFDTDDGLCLDEDISIILEELPPVKPTQRWIPVSERLPKVMDGTKGECSDDVLICVEDEKCITISTGFYGYYPCSQSEQGWWSVWAHGCEQLDNKCEVIAWMPLPKPYKESEE